MPTERSLRVHNAQVICRVMGRHAQVTTSHPCSTNTDSTILSHYFMNTDVGSL